MLRGPMARKAAETRWGLGRRCSGGAATLGGRRSHGPHSSWTVEAVSMEPFVSMEPSPGGASVPRLGATPVRSSVAVGSGGARSEAEIEEAVLSQTSVPQTRQPVVKWLRERRGGGGRGVCAADARASARREGEQAVKSNANEKRSVHILSVIVLCAGRCGAEATPSCAGAGSGSQGARGDAESPSRERRSPEPNAPEQFSVTPPARGK